MDAMLAAVTTNTTPTRFALESKRDTGLSRGRRDYRRFSGVLSAAAVALCPRQQLVAGQSHGGIFARTLLAATRDVNC